MPQSPKSGPDEIPLAAPRGSRSGPARDELKVCGLSAVQARFARDPGSIVRLFFDYQTGRKIGAMSKALAQARKVYRCVEPAELEKIAGTVHHGGIVAVVAAPGLRSPSPADLKAWAGRREPVLVLDRIGNAHNLGAIARTAAFFGVPHLIIPDDPLAARPNDAAYRVAEGGLEQIEVGAVPNLVEFMGLLKTAGFEVVGAAASVLRSANRDDERFPIRSERGGRASSTDGSRPLALVLGNEEKGLRAEVAAICSRMVTIPGSGRVESLNVSAAAAVLIWELLGKRDKGI